ncbi:GM20855 [Drosophila sechellia]|uniref:GM20855 n=2 Tax=melanogaster subgroup TaxID=32351 RepID=B4HQB3_DROSE|nr:GM20855 [Drosophila sechellia]
MTFTRLKTLSLLVCALLALSFPGHVSGAGNNNNKKGSQPVAPPEPEAVIEEVNAKQLEKLLADKDYVAVFWYARSCVTCDKVLAELEKIDDDTDSFGVDFVKINDKRLAKQYGIKNFPALTYFREKEPIIYDGDLMDEEGVLDFLTSLEAMDLPDRIEEVNAKILQKIIEDTDFVAVLFCPDHETCPPRVMDKQQCRKCAKALQELENIDDEADQLGIGFVKIHDEALADEYNLGNLPALVYYRHQTPIIYEGELQREEDVLEWLVQNKSTGDEDDVIEDVTSKTLSTLISNIDNLVVLFYDHGNDDSMTVLEELEQIDDDCDKHGIQFVKIDDAKAAADYGIDSIPAIVYFEKEIPNVYDGDLMDEEQILKWLLGQLERDEIEDVTDEMLDTMIKEGRVIAVLFYDNNDKKSQKVLEELENIDDECDALGITFVKIDNPEEAVEYGINKVPKLIYFEKGIPTIYEGNLEDEEKLLKWLTDQTSSDQIEDITDEMLDLIIEKMPHVAVLFYDKDQKKSQKILAELENIDDECDQNDIAFVKIDDDKEAKEWGIDEIPSIVLFERGIPHIYEGDLMKEDELLGWLVHQKRYSEIPEVTDEMKDKLVENTEHLAVIFYDKDDKQDMRILNELENIDDELEKEGIVIVRIDNAAEAKEYGLDHLPALIYFENKIPALYEGDLMNEDEVLEWLLVQKKTATIEEVTDEILVTLINEHEYVVVFFTGPCEPGETCEHTLNALESIDDELDEAGIIFVTTEDTGIAKKYNVKTYPRLVFFRNRDPLHFTGDLDDEDEVLAWITDDETLEIPGKIEEVNVKMLDKILAENDHVVVFFYAEGDKKAQKILNELENIDDECEEKDIDFVKTSDDDIDKEYDLPGLPALAFYRHKFRTIYTGDLMKEEEILEWVIDLHESTADVIESVDRKTLQVLINDVEHLAVFFYDDECESCSEILEELENIDDDTDKHGIQFVKSNDVKLAHEIGIFAFPALVYYETGVPIMYDGNLKNENRVLQWLVNQKNEDDGDDNEDDMDEDDEEDNNDDDEDDEEDNNDDEEDDEEDNDKDDEDDEEDNNKDDEDDEEDNNEDDKDDEDGDDEDEDENDNEDNKGDDEDDEDGDDGDEEDDDEEDGDDDNKKDNDDEDDDEDGDDQDKDDEDATGEDDNEDDEDEEEDIKNDECFYVGLGHDGHSAKRGNNFVPNDYKPFQCCPTKLEKSTKVPKMTAQRIGHSEGDQGKRPSGGNFQFAGQASSKSSTKPAATKKQAKPSKDTDDDDEDDDDKPLVKVSYANKRSGGSNKPQAGKKPVGKGQDNDDQSQEVEKVSKQKSTKKSGKLNVKSGNIASNQDVFNWILEQKADQSIQLINRDQLFEYIGTKDFLAVVFYKEDDPDSPRVLRHIELIDDEAAEYGIYIVKMHDKLMAKKYGFRNPPGLTYFRKGKYINYDGDIDDEEEVLDWLTSPANMEMTDHIEQVNRKMFEKIRKNSDYVAVIFYSDECKQCPRVLAEVEHIDDEADKAGIDFVKIDDKQMAKEYGVFALPAIVFFKPTSKEPVIYAGDLYEEEQILTWLITQKDPSGDVIEDLEGERLVHLIEESGSIAVYFWNKTKCDICNSKAARKARLKKERDQHQQEGGAASAAAAFGSEADPSEAAAGGAEDAPAAGSEGDSPPASAAAPADASTGKQEDDADGCEQCTKVLEELENIDDDCDKHGITFVKTRDFSVADGYGVHEYPALVYFEGGIPNVFEGELSEEEEVLQWLITQKTEDRIELITRQMLETMVEETQYLAVYFYKINCNICDQILEGLELIDDECDVFGIHMVKIQDPQLAKRYSIKTFPALVYFRNGNPLLFEGDLQNEQSVLEWLIDDDNRELADEIEEVNERMLDRLMAESTLLVVFFYDDDCAECEEILEELEEIDGEADISLEENEFLAVFFCDLLSEDEVLEWLRKNRFRQPELNIFMYALIALAVAFVVYTAFLLQCFKPAPPPPVQHPKQS